MDLASLAQTLINAHAERTKHLSHLLRGGIRQAYASGVKDCLRVMQEASITDQLNSQITELQSPNIQAPLAVQPNHVAGSGE